MNKYTAAVLFGFMALVFFLFLFVADVRGADAAIDALERLSLAITLIVGILIAAGIFFLALMFFVKFQQADDKGEIERLKGYRAHIDLAKAETQLQQQYAKLLPAPAQAQLPAVWDDANSTAVDGHFIIAD